MAQSHTATGSEDPLSVQESRIRCRLNSHFGDLGQFRSTVASFNLRIVDGYFIFVRTLNIRIAKEAGFDRKVKSAPQIHGG